MADHILLEVVTPEQQVLSVHVSELQFRTAERGYYGILPGHTPVLTPLGNGVLRYVSGGTNRCVTVFGGFAEVGPDRVSILAQVAETPGSLDLKALGAEREQAQKGLAEARTLEEITAAQARVEAVSIRLEALDHQT